MSDIKFNPLDLDDEMLCLMTIEEFSDSVEDGMFIDYDGDGRLATSTEVSNIYIVPSDFKKVIENLSPELKLKLTHVDWYNK